MNKSALYPKLAFQNIKNNRKFYIPYMLTGIIVVMMFYIILFMASHENIGSVYGGSYLSSFLVFGTVIIAIFSVIFLFYTNSFLMKRRRKEMGLFIILGMEKRHLAMIQFFETIYVSIVSILGGLACGILFSKLAMLLLGKMLHFETPLGFTVSVFALGVTAVAFLGIYFLIFIYNLISVGKAKPIELLKSGDVGEKEPKTKWLLTVIGTLCLLGGYAIAILVKSPLTAIFLFFIAVLLVIIGTYLLFTTGSITILKSLRGNKKYYYKTRHFISVSGMIYRMKQNAVGLANICILSTMVLVMISTTVALNIGIENVLDTNYPSDILLSFTSPGDGVAEAAEDNVLSFAKEYGADVTDIDVNTDLNFVVKIDGDELTGADDNSIISDSCVLLDFITTDEYEHRTGNQVELGENECLVFLNGAKIPDSFDLLGDHFTVKDTIDEFPMKGEFSTYSVSYSGIVVSPETFDRINSLQQNSPSGQLGSVASNIYIDVSGSDETKIDFCDALTEELQNNFSGDYVTSDGETVTIDYSYFTTMSRAENSSEIYSLYGSFLFLGVFLGLLFLMATILIMYYKQLTEGYNDKDRFEIMQKVGLSRPEIKKSIRSQILVVFFLPLAVAVLHMVFAFRIITKLLALLGLTNVTLFVVCTLCTIAAFAVIYAVVYALTAREYYGIVSQ